MSNERAEVVLEHSSDLNFLTGDGEMCSLMCSLDWSTSPLGEPSTWPQSLRSVVGLLLNSKFPMFVAWGDELGFLYNDAYAEILGAKHPHALGNRFQKIWLEIWPDISPLIDAAMAGEATYRENLPLVLNRRGIEEQAWFTFSYSPVRDERGAVAGMFCVVAETTAIVLAERRLTAQNESLFRMTPDLLAVASFDGHLKSINPAWSRVLGRSDEELLAWPFAQIIHPDDLATTGDVVARLQAGEPVHQFHVRLLKSCGDAVTFAWSAVPDVTSGSGIFYTIGRDVTVEKAREAELATAQDALRQSQKMEAVGQLTGGLAHDFNNLLTGISGSLEMIAIRIAQGRTADVDRYMLAAQGAAKRAAALTHRLLAFSRRQTLEPKPTDVNRLISGMEDLVRRTVGPGIGVESVGKAGLWPVLVDPNQLENALLNLCINARDAMPDGGKLMIETANRWLDDRAAEQRDLPPGQYVSMCVSDNGTGMSPDVIERAFDPFFTTKPIGLGTGLGLSMIYGFARQSGGQVRIYSEVGQGTMVCVYLPRHHVGQETEEIPTIAPVSKAQVGETVLVVDDEPIVRMLIVDILEDLGYAVLEAADGPSGLSVIRSNARIDMMVTDVGLPNGMNGRQLADAARELRPGLKVLFVTGYAENAVLSHGHLDLGMQVVTKPFDTTMLGNRVKSMLAAN